FAVVSLTYPKTIDPKDFHWAMLYIYSDESEAVYAGPLDGVIPFSEWPWYVLGSILLVEAIAILVRLLESPKGKYRRRLRELDRLYARYAKTKRRIARIRDQIAQIPESAIDAVEERYDRWPELAPKSRRGSKKMVLAN